VDTKPISLALQGGGSHGAFTWGVLDRFLEDDRIVIDGISGASAGSMNAVALAYGHAVGGRAGAREALRRFWTGVASKSPFVCVDEVSPQGTTANPPPLVEALASLTRFLSPYQFNPFEIDPLRQLLAEQIDFERLRADAGIKLFIAATDVRTGRLRLFRNDELTLDALLASACLPSLHRPIEIGGEAYWDGGLSANPPLYPLLHHCSARDVMVVLLHPSTRDDLPVAAEQIRQRLTEISFASAFFAELNGLVLAKLEAERAVFPVGRLERKLRALNLHVVAQDELMTQLSAQSRLNVQPAFINGLFARGRECADAWLRTKFPFLGRRSSASLCGLLPPLAEMGSAR